MTKAKAKKARKKDGAYGLARQLAEALTHGTKLEYEVEKLKKETTSLKNRLLDSSQRAADNAITVAALRMAHGNMSQDEGLLRVERALQHIEKLRRELAPEVFPMKLDMKLSDKAWFATWKHAESGDEIGVGSDVTVADAKRTKAP